MWFLLYVRFRSKLKIIECFFRLNTNFRRHVQGNITIESYDVNVINDPKEITKITRITPEKCWRAFLMRTGRVHRWTVHGFFSRSHPKIVLGVRPRARRMRFRTNYIRANTGSYELSAYGEYDFLRQTDGFPATSRSLGPHWDATDNLRRDSILIRRRLRRRFDRRTARMGAWNTFKKRRIGYASKNYFPRNDARSVTIWSICPGADLQFLLRGR